MGDVKERAGNDLLPASPTAEEGQPSLPAALELCRHIMHYYRRSTVVRPLNHRALAWEDESVTMATRAALKSVHIQTLSPVSYCICK